MCSNGSRMDDPNHKAPGLLGSMNEGCPWSVYISINERINICPSRP
jgi:hypothetical protein